MFQQVHTNVIVSYGILCIDSHQDFSVNLDGGIDSAQLLHEICFVMQVALGQWLLGCFLFKLLQLRLYLCCELISLSPSHQTDKPHQLRVENLRLGEVVKRCSAALIRLSEFKHPSAFVVWLKEINQRTASRNYESLVIAPRVSPMRTIDARASSPRC